LAYLVNVEAASYTIALIAFFTDTIEARVHIDTVSILVTIMGASFWVTFVYVETLFAITVESSLADAQVRAFLIGTKSIGITIVRVADTLMKSSVSRKYKNKAKIPTSFHTSYLIDVVTESKS
jgi:hypothetical protein